MQAVGGAAVVAPGREVLRLHDERVALPAAAGVAVPLPDGLRQVRPAPDRDHPRIVERLADEGQPGGRLHDLVVGVGSGAEVPAEPGDAGRDAAVDAVQIFRPGLELPAAVDRRLARLGRRGERRDPPVRRVDDERRPVGERHVDHPDRAAGRPRDVGLHVLQRRAERALRRGEGAAPVGEDPLRARRQRGDLLPGQVRAAGQRRQPLEGRGHVVEPDPLQVGTPLRGAGRLPRVGGLPLRGRRRPHQGQRQQRSRETSRLHDGHLRWNVDSPAVRRKRRGAARPVHLRALHAPAQRGAGPYAIRKHPSARAARNHRPPSPGRKRRGCERRG